MTRSAVLFRLGLLVALTGAWLARGADAPAPAPAETVPPPPPLVWEKMLRDFSDDDYAVAVEQVMADFERATGKALKPGPRGKVGLKIYADSGPGLTTPHALLRAVIAALERRGFQSKNIFLVGLNQLRLRFCGFLPALSTGRSTFADHPVYVLESGRYYDPEWFYDSPLPARFNPGVFEAPIAADEETANVEQDRKSFLATPLFFDADFWINLPAYTDHPVLGVNGALVNATLWNASNTQRFFRSPANAPAAVAEMAAIPELRERWVLNIVSLERYQFIGGPFFNSLYTTSEPRLWASADPVLIDALMLERLNLHRKRAGFEPMVGDRRLLEFADQLGVGSSRVGDVQWRRF